MYDLAWREVQYEANVGMRPHFSTVSSYFMFVQLSTVLNLDFANEIDWNKVFYQNKIQNSFNT